MIDVIHDVASYLPAEMLNPLFHAVEWLRSAYYEGYGATTSSTGDIC